MRSLTIAQAKRLRGAMAGIKLSMAASSPLSLPAHTLSAVTVPNLEETSISRSKGTKRIGLKK